MSSNNQSYTNQLEQYLSQTSQNPKKSQNNSINETHKSNIRSQNGNQLNEKAKKQQSNQNSIKENQSIKNNKQESNENNQNLLNNKNGLGWIHNVSTLNSNEKQSKGLQSFFSEIPQNMTNIQSVQQIHNDSHQRSDLGYSHQRFDSKSNEQGVDFLSQPFEESSHFGEEYIQDNEKQGQKYQSNLEAKIDTFGNDHRNTKNEKMFFQSSQIEKEGFINQSTIQYNKNEGNNQDMLIKSILNQLMCIATTQQQNMSHYNNDNTHSNNNTNTIFHKRQQSDNQCINLDISNENEKSNQLQNPNFEQNKYNKQSLNKESNYSSLNLNTQNQNNEYITNGSQSTKNQNLYNLDDFKPKKTISKSPSSFIIVGNNNNDNLQNQILNSSSTSYNIENFLPQKKYLHTSRESKEEQKSSQYPVQTPQQSIHEQKNLNVQEFAQLLIQEFSNQYKEQRNSNDLLNNQLQLQSSNSQIKQKQSRLSYVTLPSLNLQLKSATKMVSEVSTQTNSEYQNEQYLQQFLITGNNKSSQQQTYQMNAQQMQIIQQQQQLNQQNKGINQSIISRRSSLQNQNTIQQHPGFEYELESELLSEEIHFNHHSILQTNNTQHNQNYQYKKGSLATEQVTIPTINSPNIMKIQNTFPTNNMSNVSQKMNFKRKGNEYNENSIHSSSQDETGQNLTSQSSQNKIQTFSHNKPPHTGIQQHNNFYQQKQNQQRKQIENRNNPKFNQNQPFNGKQLQDIDDNQYDRVALSSLEVKSREKLYELELQQIQLDKEFQEKQKQYYNQNRQIEDESEKIQNHRFQNRNQQQFLPRQQLQGVEYPVGNISYPIGSGQYSNVNEEYPTVDGEYQNMNQEYATVNEDYPCISEENLDNEDQTHNINQKQIINKHQIDELKRMNDQYNIQQEQGEDNNIDLETIMRLERIPFPNISLSRKDSIATNSNYGNLPSQNINNGSILYNSQNTGNQENSLIQQSGYLQNSFNNGQNSYNNSFVSVNIFHSKIPKGFTNSQMKQPSYQGSTNQNFQQSSNINFSHQHNPSDEITQDYYPEQIKSENNKPNQLKNQTQQVNNIQNGPEKKQQTFSFNQSDYLLENNLNTKHEDEELIINNKNISEDNYSKQNINQQQTQPDSLITFKTFGQTMKPTSSTLKLSQREVSSLFGEQKQVLSSPIDEEEETLINSAKSIYQQANFEKKIIMIQSFFRYCWQYKREQFRRVLMKNMTYTKLKSFAQKQSIGKSNKMNDKNKSSKNDEIQQSSELFIDSMFKPSSSIKGQNNMATNQIKKGGSYIPNSENLNQKEISQQPNLSTRRSDRNIQGNNQSTINCYQTTSHNFGDSKVSYDLTVSPTTERRIFSTRGGKKQSPRSGRLFDNQKQQDYNQIFENNQQIMLQTKDLQSQIKNLKLQQINNQIQTNNESVNEQKQFNLFNNKQQQEEKYNQKDQQSQFSSTIQNKSSRSSERINLSDNKILDGLNSNNASKISRDQSQMADFRSLNSAASMKSTYFANQINMPMTHINNIPNILEAIFNS